MRRISVHGEISATAYKKLAARLRNYSKKALWKVLDHYLFHIMEEKHADELMKILDGMEETSTVTASADEGFVLPAVESDGKAPSRRRYQSTAVLKEPDLKANRDRLDLMYDVNYFSYLHPDVMKPNAEALLAFAKSEKLPVSSHWDLFAVKDVFLALREEDE